MFGRLLKHMKFAISVVLFAFALSLSAVIAIRTTRRRFRES